MKRKAWPVAKTKLAGAGIARQLSPSINISLKFWRPLFFCFAALSLCSCTTHGPDGSVSKHYFGYTVVTFPKVSGNCKAMDAREVTNVGMSIGPNSGLSLGYNRDAAVSLSPGGHVIIEVRTDAQFEAAKEFINQLNSLGICIIESPKSYITLNSKR